MSILYDSNFNLQKNQLQNAVAQNLASAPSSPVEGQFYYDTTLNALGYYDGTVWVYTSEGTVQSVSSGTGVTVDNTDPANPIINANINDSTTGTNLLWSSTKTNSAIQAATAGLVIKGSVLASTTTALPAYNYNNGASGVGRTIVSEDVNPVILDGVACGIGTLVLVKNETAGNAPYNGIYTVTDPGSLFASYTGTPAGASTAVTITAVNAGTTANSVVLTFDGSTTITAAISAWNIANPSNTIALTTGDGSQTPDNGEEIDLSGGTDQFFTLTGATNFDSSTTILPNSYVFVSTGTTLHDTGWILNLDGTCTVGTTDIDFTQFSGAGTYTGGEAIDITDQVISALYDGSTIGLNGSNELYVPNDGITENQVSDGAFLSTGGLQGGDGGKFSIRPDVTTGATVVPIATSINGAGITVDNSSIENNAGTARVKALGITNGMLAGSIADSKLNQITTANKVAGSAVQIDSGSPIYDDGGDGLNVRVSGDTIILNNNAGSYYLDIGDDGVTTSKIADGAVTPVKLANQYRASFVSGDFSGGILEVTAGTHGLGANLSSIWVQDASDNIHIGAYFDGSGNVFIPGTPPFNGFVVITA